MAIKRTNIRLIIYLTDQGVPQSSEFYYTKYNDNDPDITSEKRHADPIPMDGTLTINQFILNSRPFLR